MSRPSLQERLETCENPLLKKLFKIIIEKKTNVCAAANFDSFQDVIKFADEVGPHICILKTQSLRYEEDRIHVFEVLYKKKKEHNFLLFEDIKYNDGEETVQSYYKHIVEYVDLVTVDPDFGDPMFSAIRNTVLASHLPSDQPRGCIGLLEFSFSGRLTERSANLYFKSCEKNNDICPCVVAQKFILPTNRSNSFVKMTPGVHISKTTDGDSQQWNHPTKVIANGTDIIIVGRGITSKPESEWASTACLYKDVAFKALIDQSQV